MCGWGEWSESLYLKVNLILKQARRFQPNFMKISFIWGVIKKKDHLLFLFIFYFSIFLETKKKEIIRCIVLHRKVLNSTDFKTSVGNKIQFEHTCVIRRRPGMSFHEDLFRYNICRGGAMWSTWSEGYSNTCKLWNLLNRLLVWWGSLSG